MENKRCCIAVIVSDICEVYQSLLLNGIKKMAVEKGCNVAVFGAFFARGYDAPLNEVGENNIFNLINYERFDGFIVLPDSIADEEVLRNIENSLSKTNKPVIYIDREHEKFISICSDDYNSVKMITDHLINEHGYKRINCLTGFKGMNVAEARLQGYKDALAENDIPVEEDRYSYGDFWRTSPIAFVEKIMNCGLELPEAIVCANDIMAIAVCEELGKRGISVPDDIAVTGYDRIVDGRIFNPKISTLCPSMERIGEKAVEVILDILSGKPVEKDYSIIGEFFPDESCGCPSSAIMSYGEDVSIAHENIQRNQFFISSIYMHEKLYESKGVDELFLTAYSFMSLIDKIKTLHLIICEDWDELNEEIILSASGSARSGYSKNMITKFAFNGELFEGSLGTFESSQMFPPIFDDKGEPQMYFFLPMNFRDLSFGYAVCTYTEGVPDAIFRYWLKNFSNTLEHVRLEEQLKILIEKKAH